MAKTNSSFNLSKSVKRIAGTILNKEARSVYVAAMIDAESAKLKAKSQKFVDPAVSQKARGRREETPTES